VDIAAIVHVAAQERTSSASRSARPAGRRNRWATDPRRWLRASGQGARHRRGDGGERGSSTSPGTVGPRRRGLVHGSGG